MRSARSLRVLVLFSLAVAPAAAQGVIGKVSGNGTPNHFGVCLARFNDVDGDGYLDYLAGQPGEPQFLSQNDPGEVQVLSGRYLATGLGAPLVMTIGNTPPGLAGASLASPGDLDGDGIWDIVYGIPYRATGFLNPPPHGRVSVRNAVDFIERGIDGSGAELLGTAVAVLTDIDGDGVRDILAGAPGYSATLPPLPNIGRVGIYSGAHLLQNQKVELRNHFGYHPQEGFGSVLSVGKYDADTTWDYAVGSPHRLSSTNVPDSGRVYLYSGATGSVLREVAGPAGSHFGASLDASGDLTGDGVADLVVGAPYASVNGAESGSVYVYSGASLVSGGFLIPYRVWHGTQVGAHFGAAVAAVDDVNGDGNRDVLVGAPDYQASLSTSGHGRVYCYSGETGELMGQITGASNEHLGGALSSAYKVDGKPGYEFLVGSPDCSVTGSPTGRVALVSIYPNSPTAYCSSQQNSLGCTGSIAWSGTPSAGSPAGFHVTASNVLNNKLGILFYGYDADAKPFYGGTLCVAGPLKRTPVQDSGGTAAPAKDCSGSFDFFYGALITGGSNPNLTVGQEVFCQYWSRDSASPAGANTTNALRFLINP